MSKSGDQIKSSQKQVTVNMASGAKSSQKLSNTQPVKRAHVEVANSSAEEITIITQQLDTLSENMCIVKEELKDIMKKGDIESLISNTVSKIIEGMEQRMIALFDSKLKEKTLEMTNKIESLEFEKNELKAKFKTYESNVEKNLEKLRQTVYTGETLAREANKRANQNEQYSRKNNVKIMNIPQEVSETEDVLITKVCDLFHTKGNVTIAPEKIMAIHRIPGKPGMTKPVLVKLTNNNAKTTLMRKRSATKAAGHKLVDDVTKLNQGLINRLTLHKDMDSAWFFNGSVFGKTTTGVRHKFDIYDNVNTVIHAPL